MATAGEGPSAAPSSGYGGNGGVGGKFRKRPFRKTHTTPYDRPPTALRNPSWLSKLVVEPASKLIASGAQRFFASVFRKRLPPPHPTSPELNQVSRDEQPKTVQEAEAQEAAVVNGENLTQNPGNGGISDLEQLLRKKTFTRAEIDRLTELLHSRAVDTPHKSDFRTEANDEKLVSNSERKQQYLANQSEETRSQYDISHGLIATPGISARVLEEDIASPAEIAKAYMGKQASKVSPSMLGLRTRAVREDATLLSNVPFTPKSTMMSLVAKAGSHVEVPENGYATPRPRGRSAIYNMARTPYSRVHPTAFEKGSGSRLYGFGGPLLPAPSVKEPHGELRSNRMALKRRSSALDDDLGSVGPMRRTRQKPSVLSHRTFLPQGIGGVSAAQQHPFMDERVYKGLKVMGENDDNRTPRTSYARVPPKSTEMATKILEHLEKMTPKTKSAELKLIAAKEKSPAKLTADMLRGQALKSLEDADSSKLLHSDHVGNKLEGGSHSKQVSSGVSTPQQKDRTEENVLPKFDSQSNAVTLVENSDTTSVKGIFTSVEASDSVAKSVGQRPQKKRAFRMSAHEDLLDLDDDTNFDGTASKVLPKFNANPETIENENSASVEKSLPNKLPDLPEIRTLAEPISGKRLDLERVDAAVMGQEKAGPSFPFSGASTATSSLVTTHPSSLEFENSNRASDKVLGSENSSLLSVAEPAEPKPWSLTLLKPDTLSSSDGVATSVTDASLRIPGSEKGIDNNVQEAAITNGKLDTSPSVALSSTSSGGVSSIFPNSSSNNGPSVGSPSILSSMSAPASTGLANLFLTNGTSKLAASASTTSSAATTSFLAASSSVPFSSTEAAVFPKMPIFSSGSSGNPSISAFSASSASNAETPATKTGKESNAGNSSNLPFVNTSFATVGTGSSIFGLSSKITSSTALSQSQDSLSSSGSGSMLNAQSVTAAMPVQFGSSAPSAIFGTSGVATFTSINTLFSSTTTAAKPLGPGTDLGPSSSASLSETKSFGPSSSATSSIFSVHVNAPSSSSATNVISSNSGNAPPPFNLGGSSSATASVTNAIISSTAAAAPVYSFGGSSSVGNVVSSSTGSTGVFGVGPLSSSTENNPASSSSATTSIFGGSWQAPKSSPFSSAFNSSPSSGFPFGGSSSFASTNTAPMVFGSSTGGSTGPLFSFTMTSASTSSSQSLFGAQPVFGSSAPSFTASAANNDQMNTEDSMAEDPVHSSMSAAPVFGQQSVSPSPGGFMFGSAVPSQTSPFQFGGQPNQTTSQNTPLFQASGSQEFGSAGGSFSLGSGGMGGDKSGRKFVKVSRNRNRKK